MRAIIIALLPVTRKQLHNLHHRASNVCRKILLPQLPYVAAFLLLLLAVVWLDLTKNSLKEFIFVIVLRHRDRCQAIKFIPKILLQ